MDKERGGVTKQADREMENGNNGEKQPNKGRGQYFLQFQIDEYYYGVRIFPGQDLSNVWVGWVTPQFHAYDKLFDANASVRKCRYAELDQHGITAERSKNGTISGGKGKVFFNSALLGVTKRRKMKRETKHFCCSAPNIATVTCLTRWNCSMRWRT